MKTLKHENKTAREEKILIQLAKSEDSRAIYNIRYEPLVDALSRNHEVVSFEKHNVWFKKQYFSGLENKCFVLRVDGVVGGYCRFDKNDKSEFNISIAILPKFQGKGFGKKLLSESMALMGSNKVFIASVFKNNSVSLKLFQRNGFGLINEDKQQYYLRR